jgi:hypothetical protein
MKQLYRKYDRVLQSGMPTITGPHWALSGLPRTVGATLTPIDLGLFQSLTRLRNRDSGRRQLSAAMYREEQK